MFSISQIHISMSQLSKLTSYCTDQYNSERKTLTRVPCSIRQIFHPQTKNPRLFMRNGALIVSVHSLLFLLTVKRNKPGYEICLNERNGWMIRLLR